MCKYCNGNTKLFDRVDNSNSDNMTDSLSVNVTKNGNLTINLYHIDYGNWPGYFGYDDDDDPIVRESLMSKRIKINYCPMCGRKL